MKARVLKFVRLRCSADHYKVQRSNLLPLAVSRLGEREYLNEMTPLALRLSLVKSLPAAGIEIPNLEGRT